MRRVGSAKDEFFLIDQVNQAGIALHEFDNERDDALQDFVQAHLTDHETAHPLKKTELLFSALQALLQILELGHCLIIGVASKLERDDKLADAFVSVHDNFRGGKTG